MKYIFILLYYYFFYSQTQQYPFLNNFNTDAMFAQQSQVLTEQQQQALTEDTFPPSTVEKMNELYINDQESLIDQRLSFATFQ